MYFARLTTIAVSVATIATGQTPTTYNISAFAGAPRVLGDGGQATSALLWSPRGIALDAAGNLYIADTGHARIRKVGADGTITTVAGSAPGFAGDGGAPASAMFAFPSRVAVAANGDIYVADSANNRVRRIGSNGVVTTVAGTGMAGFNGESDAATAIQLSFPRDVAVDPNGNVFVADTNNVRIRRVTLQGRLATIAGSGLFGFQGDDGAATRAALAGPRGVTADATGNIYIADTLNHRIRKITPDGTITTLAGGYTAGYSGDGGQATFAQLNLPTSVAVDRSGNVYFTDTGNHRVRRISAGRITTIAGSSTSGFSGDNGPAALARLNAPESVAVDAAGNVYIADTENHRIRRVNSQGVITTVAGSDPGAGDNGPAVAARLFQPSGVAVDPSGNVYIADMANHRVRRVTPQGRIENVAGNGAAGYAGDGNLATLAQLNGPNGLAIDRAGSLYIADTGNHVIRRVSGGVITTVAGTGEAGKDGDAGPATTARLFQPSAVAFDRLGNMLIADSANNRIRVVSNGMIRNFAGDPAGLPGFGGDGGPAATANFDYPISLAVDDGNNVYVSDYFNNRVRRITPGGGTVTTFAGTGVRGGLGDGGPASQAQFALPAGLAFDNNRNLYVTDLLNNRVRMIGANGIVQTVVGSGARGDVGDGGPATAAALASPRDVAADGLGNLYFSDQDNNRVRKLSLTTLAIRTVVNAASGVAGPVAPGEAVAIYGTQLGSDVTFDGVTAQVLYASSNQVNVIVPRQIAGRTFTELRVGAPGIGSSTFTLTVRDAAPGIFTLTGTGTGQGAVINEDGTINSTANPAQRGSIVAIYGTGQGVLSGASVKILGIEAEILFAGETAPGLFQVNARVPPDSFASDRAPVELVVGSFAAQPGVTIAIR